MKYELSIIGLGYVDLPVGLQFAKSGCRVLGLDVDEAKVREIPQVFGDYLAEVSRA